MDEADDDGSLSGSRIRLADPKSAVAVTSVEQMRSLAVENRLGLCNYSYGPLDATAVWNGSGAEAAAERGWGLTSLGDCALLLTVDSSDEAVVMNGYLSPVVVLLTLVTNALVCAVLLQRHMRTPTNVFLVALAVSDALTGAIPLPLFVRFYTSGAYRSMLVPPPWCHFYLPMILHVPTMCHTASIWLTVGLAFQRYVYICRQTVAKRLCTVRNAVVAVAGVYAAAVVSQLSRNFEDRYEPISHSVPLGDVDVDDSAAAERVNITGCYLVPILAQHAELHLGIYW